MDLSKRSKILRRCRAWMRRRFRHKETELSYNSPCKARSAAERDESRPLACDFESSSPCPGDEIRSTSELMKAATTLRIRTIALPCLAASLVVVASITIMAQTPGNLTNVNFDREVRPIVSNNCFRCHGPDQSSRVGGFRLDLRDEALKPQAQGTPIIP